MILGVEIKKSLETNLIHIAKPYIDSLREEIQETILEISQKLYLKPPLPGGS